MLLGGCSKEGELQERSSQAKIICASAEVNLGTFPFLLEPFYTTNSVLSCLPFLSCEYKTSPHLPHVNEQQERVNQQGAEVGDTKIIDWRLWANFLTLINSPLP